MFSGHRWIRQLLRLLLQRCLLLLRVWLCWKRLLRSRQLLGSAIHLHGRGGTLLRLLRTSLYS
jgi:hypothetical protein